MKQFKKMIPGVLLAVVLAPSVLAQGPTLDVTLVPDFSADQMRVKLEIAGAEAGSDAILFYAFGLTSGVDLGSLGTLYLDPSTLGVLAVVPIDRSGTGTLSGVLTPDFPNFSIAMQAVAVKPGSVPIVTDFIALGGGSGNDPDCSSVWGDGDIVPSNGMDDYEIWIEGDPGLEISLLHYDKSKDEHFDVDSQIIPLSGELFFNGTLDMDAGDLLEVHCEGSGLWFICS